MRMVGENWSVAIILPIYMATTRLDQKDDIGVSRYAKARCRRGKKWTKIYDRRWLDEKISQMSKSFIANSSAWV